MLKEIYFAVFFIWMLEPGILALVLIGLSDELKQEVTSIKAAFMHTLVYPLFPTLLFRYDHKSELHFFFFNFCPHEETVPKWSSVGKKKCSVFSFVAIPTLIQRDLD